MGNLIRKCLDILFLTDLWHRNIIRLFMHQNPQNNWKRPKNFLKSISKATNQFYRILKNFFGFLGPFGCQNSAIAIFLTSKAIKAKKATKRPKITNLSCGKVLGPKMVSQGFKQSYKMIWRPYRTPFSQKKILEAKKRPLGCKFW